VPLSRLEKWPAAIFQTTPPLPAEKRRDFFGLYGATVSVNRPQAGVFALGRGPQSGCAYSSGPLSRDGALSDGADDQTTNGFASRSPPLAAGGGAAVGALGGVGSKWALGFGSGAFVRLSKVACGSAGR
jgi:hypothetical protein